MQSIDELARTIKALDPSDQQALMEKISSIENDNESDPRFKLMQEAMKDEFFLADLREVMKDFRHVDSEETVA